MENLYDLNKISHDEMIKNIYHKYFRILVFYSVSYIHRSDIAEDIVQEVIINFVDKKRYNNLKGSVLNYLKGAVIKASLKYIRDNGKTIFYDLETVASQNVIDIIEEEDNVLDKLLKYIDELPDRRKEIVKMILFDSKKQSEVAKELSISVNSVKTQYYKSLASLKNTLNKTYSFFF